MQAFAPPLPSPPSSPLSIEDKENNPGLQPDITSSRTNDLTMKRQLSQNHMQHRRVLASSDSDTMTMRPYPLYADLINSSEVRARFEIFVRDCIKPEPELQRPWWSDVVTWVCDIVRREGMDVEMAKTLKRHAKTDTENYIWFVYEVVRLLTLSNLYGNGHRLDKELEMTCWVALKVLVCSAFNIT